MDNKKVRPLEGLRVLDFGHYIAGPLAGVFLADQGADVVRVQRPGAPIWDANTEQALSRRKRLVPADLKSEAGRKAVLDLAAQCDVILENFRPGVMDRLGVGCEAIKALNPSVIYVSMPAYSRHDPRAGQAAWDGTINAASGLFTDLSVGGAALDLPPTYTPLPLPSVYAGLWGAIAAMAALHGRQKHGRGDRIEAPLMDAAMSAAAGVIFQLAGQPARYNAPPLSRKLLDRISLRGISTGMAARAHGVVDRLMPPFFRNYVCGDGQLLFICAIDNANHIGKLIDATSLRKEVAALGFEFGDVLDIPPSRKNINAYRGSSSKWKALKRLLDSRFATDTAENWAERLAKAGVPAVRQRSTSEWLAMPVMQQAGVVSRRPDGTIQPAPQVDVSGIRSATSLDAPVATADDGWRSPRTFAPPKSADTEHSKDAAPLSGVKVLDLANVIAGPSAGRTLAELGAEVVHVSAVKPRMGPRMNLLLGIEVNQGKRSIALDLHHAQGQAVVRKLIPETDVLIYNKLPEQAKRLGVAPEQVHAINDRTIVSTVTAYGGALPGGWESRPAYDPVIQALTGIMQRFGGATTPAVHGIASCIDYFTGYAAAFGALVGLVARGQGDRCLVSRTSLTRTAGWVQLPQVCNPGRETPTGLQALGEVGFDRLYRARGGWVHVGAAPRHGGPMDGLEPLEVQARLIREIGSRTPAAALEWLHSRGLVGQRVLSARDARRSAVIAAARETAMLPTQASGVIVNVAHPTGQQFFVPDASWLRFDTTPRRRPAHAPTPGQHSEQVLHDLGYSRADINHLFRDGIAAKGWPGLTGYVPE